MPTRHNPLDAGNANSSNPVTCGPLSATPGKILMKSAFLASIRQRESEAASAMPTDKFYLSREWRSFRAAFLRVNPACSVPACQKPASHVDHIVSRRKGGADLDPANCQALCDVHHTQKTNRDDRPDRKATRNKPIRASGCDASGLPISPDHPWSFLATPIQPWRGV